MVNVNTGKIAFKFSVFSGFFVNPLQPLEFCLGLYVSLKIRLSTWLRKGGDVALGTAEMGQWVKVLAARPVNQESHPTTMVAASN